MIFIITGLPGNGKTLYTISKVREKAARENRPVFYHGIPELSLDWEAIDDPKEWAKVPPGAIVVIDEAQKTFRNRSLGSVPPSYVTDLETHRHLGIDLVLITQHPSLIDPAVRRLAGSHEHLVRIWGGQASTVHKWDAVKDNCDKARSDSQSRKWAFDRSLYGVYKSAEVHTMKRSIPMRVKLLLLVPLAVIAAAWVVYTTVVKKSPQSAPGAVVAHSAQGFGVPSPGQQEKVFDPMADARNFVAVSTPRIEGLPHTAPKYDEITQPVTAPVPAACFQIGTPRSSKPVRCKCFTQQGTPMSVEFNMCIDFAQNGYFQDFDPDRNRQRKESQPQVIASNSAPAESPNVVFVPDLNPAGVWISKPSKPAM